MIGYRNTFIILAALASSTWLGVLGVIHGADLLGLATLIGAKDAAAAGAIFARAANKRAENGNGK